jgi:hypothetical protein
MGAAGGGGGGGAVVACAPANHHGRSMTYVSSGSLGPLYVGSLAALSTWSRPAACRRKGTG